jgi:hypothetical protein
MQKHFLPAIPLDDIRSWLSAHSKTVEKLQTHAGQLATSPLGVRQRSNSNPSLSKVFLSSHTESPAPIPTPFPTYNPTMPLSLSSDDAHGFYSTFRWQSSAPQTSEPATMARRSYYSFQPDPLESAFYPPPPFMAGSQVPFETGVFAAPPFFSFAGFTRPRPMSEPLLPAFDPASLSSSPGSMNDPFLSPGPPT